MYAHWAFDITSQMLAILSLFGLGMCLWQLRKANYPGHLIAFALMLLGTLMREAVALSFDPTAWTAAAMAWSAAARVVKIVGALLFVRVVTAEKCGDWAWITLALSAIFLTAAVPL